VPPASCGLNGRAGRNPSRVFADAP
jgi:hypothetical protein